MDKLCSLLADFKNKLRNSRQKSYLTEFNHDWDKTDITNKN